MSKCVVCQEIDVPEDSLLDCGHSICCEDIRKLRNFSCPICRNHLSGKIITEEISRQILMNQIIDEDRSMMMDRMHMIRLALDPNYVPEDHYDDDPHDYFNENLVFDEGEVYQDLVLPPGLSVTDISIETLQELLS